MIAGSVMTGGEVGGEPLARSCGDGVGGAVLGGEVALDVEALVSGMWCESEFAGVVEPGGPWFHLLSGLMVEVYESIL